MTLSEIINKEGRFNNIIIDEDLEQSSAKILCSIINNVDLYFFNDGTSATWSDFNNINIEKINYLIRNSTSKFYFKTSGTTGAPKLIKQNINTFLNGIIITPKLSNAVWGFCYSTRHISGILLMLQAWLTNTKYIDLRNKSSDQVSSLIKNNLITHISAPSSFYRLILPLRDAHNSVLKVSNGGEPIDHGLFKNISSSFPNAEIRNIYASTEFGSLLVSKGDLFEIPEKLSNKVQIKHNRIHVHRDMISPSVSLDEEWYDTKDLVEMVNENQFYIKGRVSEDVKVLGHLVSLRKVENKIQSIAEVKLARVKILQHNVFGSILKAEIMLYEKESISAKEIKRNLKESLRDYEVPTKIEIVDNINLTYSGKLSRI